jgi:hypothetical protein
MAITGTRPLDVIPGLKIEMRNKLDKAQLSEVTDAKEFDKAVGSTTGAKNGDLVGKVDDKWMVVAATKKTDLMEALKEATPENLTAAFNKVNA